MIAARVAYLGWLFHGTNVQPDVRTVEGVMEEVLGRKVRFLSRTDRGVSALDNVAIVKGDTNPMKANEIEGVWVKGWLEVRKVPRVLWRWYRYYLPREIRPPREEVEKFVGRKDFRYLTNDREKNTVREVLRIEVHPLVGFTVVDVIGRSFLRQMVRRLVGALELLEEGVKADDILKGEHVPDPVPPEGLVLLKVKTREYIPVERDIREDWRRLWERYRVRSFVLSSFHLSDV